MGADLGANGQLVGLLVCRAGDELAGEFVLFHSIILLYIVVKIHQPRQLSIDAHRVL